ncbi:hypothetical protein B0H14DRAFT_89988 [Mycena olivaceomarginata]|nr:hypothetical protein B0H14DRAFT_89988 [Mycena olivaceomarginata]
MIPASSSRALCSRLCQIPETGSLYRKVKTALLRAWQHIGYETILPNVYHLCRAHSVDLLTGTCRGFDPTWDHVFKNIQEEPPQIPHTGGPGVGPRRPRRQTMTAQEIGAFNEIFNLIFDSMSEKAAASGESSLPVNAGGTGMGDLFGTLRRHSKRMKWTAQSDEDLDRKKDEMDRCSSDRELLEWAMREVFGESQHYEQEFNKARAEQDDSGALPMLQPPTYPHLIALLMKTFRDKYRDPPPGTIHVRLCPTSFHCVLRFWLLHKRLQRAHCDSMDLFSRSQGCT